METNKKYFLYVRKSTEDKDKQVASISSQIDELKKLAERMDYEIVQIFQESKSAKAPDVRIEFYKMLERIKKGEAEGILCWKLDRLARNPVDGGKINWMLQEGIIKHIKTFDRDYLPGDNTLMATLEFGMANQFIIDLRNNTLRGMRAKAGKGIFPSRAPIGYKNEITGKQGENRIFIDEERFSSIRKLWDLLLSEKYSVGEITEIAQNELGITGMKGNPISDSVLYKLFGNPFYYGAFLWQKKLWEGTHTPMITKEEFDKAQKIIKRKGPYETDRNNFAYTRIMKCGECGCGITAEVQKKKLKNGSVNEHVYYRCSKQKGPKSCSMSYIKLNKVEEKIEETLKELDIPKSLSTWMFQTLREEFKQEQELQKQTLENLQQAYDRYENQLKNLFDMRMNGEITSETHEIKKAEITTLRDEAKEKLNKTDNRLDKWLNDAENDFKWAEEAIEVIKSKDLPAKRVILEKLGTEIVLQSTGVQIELSPILKLVRRTNKTLKEQKVVFEPNNNFIEYGQKSCFDPLSLQMGAYRDLNLK
jgi:site-specific DNA recombinase